MSIWHNIHTAYIGYSKINSISSKVYLLAEYSLLVNFAQNRRWKGINKYMPISKTLHLTATHLKSRRRVETATENLIY